MATRRQERQDGEPDRLKIPAGEGGGQGYHYSRRERLSLGSAPPPRPEGGFFRRNRHLLIILLDLLILVLLFYGVRAFVLGGQERTRLGGYQVTLRGFPYEDVVLASLSVRRISSKPAGGFTRIRVRFMLEDGGEAVAAEAALPDAAGEEILLRQALPAVTRAGILAAEVVLSGAEGRAERKEQLTFELEW